MKSFRSLICGLTGGLVGLGVATLFFLMGIQSSYMNLFFGFSVITGVASGVIGGRVNESILRHRGITDSKLYRVLGELRAEYSKDFNKQESLVVLDQVEYLLKDGEL
jgi:hypothetical protein